MDPYELVSPELARHLTEISQEISRQLGVLLTREGSVQSVIVGDASKLQIPEIGRLRGGQGRFRGLRLVHTHLRDEPLSADDLNDLALLRLDMVAVIEARPDGLPGKVEAAHILPGEGEEPFRFFRAPSVHDLDLNFSATIQALEREFSRIASETKRGRKQERILLVALSRDDAHVAEMVELIKAANVTLVGIIRQSRRTPHPKTVVGRGKLDEIVLGGMRRQADAAVFDVDLKPAQARAFEDATGIKAVDRTQLILDIFAQRARSRDGKLQVELAQLKYSLPRLTEKDAGLSRLTGGIGGRGPGETVMEVGRRRIRDRIRKLEKQVEKLSRQRDLRRRRRTESSIPVLSIVGYTNAGKTTLLNALTDSEIQAADRLFMTLDPTSRRLRFPEEEEVVITDTVGFIRDLPEDLVAAFKATLEELSDADMLLHILDASDTDLDQKYQAVRSILDELQLLDIPMLNVLNKIDLIPPEEAESLAMRYDAVPVSATEKTNLGKLIDAARRKLFSVARS